MTEQLHFNGIPTQQKAVIKCFQLFVHEANNSLQFLFMTINEFKRRGQGVLTEETILSSEWTACISSKREFLTLGEKQKKNSCF